MSDLIRRARLHGTRSKCAGDEPSRRELTEHWPKVRKQKKGRFQLTKRARKRKRKDRANRRADVANYQVRLGAPWSLYVKEEG